MKTKPTILIILLLLAGSCQTNTATKEDTASVAEPTTRYTGPIIDVHSHAFSEGSSFNNLLGQDMFMDLTGLTYTAPESMDAVREGTIEKYKKHNIVLAVVTQGQLWEGEQGVDIMIGNGHYLPVETLRSMHAEGKLHVLGETAPNYDGLLPTDPSLVPYFDLAEELQIPMAFHMFPGGPPGGAYFMYPKTRAHQGKPLQLEEILLSRPGMKIYIMHAGWPFLDDMKALMYAHPQVYVDVGVISWVIPRKEFHHFVKGLVDAGFGKRILFGVDQMVWPGTIDTAVEAIQTAEFLTLEQKGDIFYNNAARFLELTEEQIAKHKK